MPEPTDWVISRHTFSCQRCSSWVAAGQTIARLDRRWVSDPFSAQVCQ